MNSPAQVSRRRGVSSAVIPFLTSVVICALAGRSVAAPPTIFTASGTADVTTAIASFKTAIGGVDNGGAPPPKATGFRTINWDGVKLDGTDFGGKTVTIDLNKTVAIPVNRFQARGVVFAEVYSVSGDGFTSVNPNAATLFPAFSAANTFAMFNERTIDFDFVLASDPTKTPVPGASRGLGVVFLNVELANKTSIEFFSGSRSVQKVFAPVTAGKQPSFVGALFDTPVVTSISITCGTDTLFTFKNGKFAAVGKDDPTHKHNIVVTDDFIYAEPVPSTDSFSAITGTYTGLISPLDVHAKTGIASVRLDKTGSFTGKVTLGGVTKPVRGKFATDGTASADVLFGTAAAPDKATLALTADFVNGTDKLTGTLTKDGDALAVALDRAVFTTKNPSPQAGKFTLAIAAGTGTAPHGTSFGLVKVTPAGLLTVAGKLADGTAFAQSVGIAKDGTWPFYVPLYRGAGSIGGDQLASQGGFVGSARWFRPASSTAIFGAGFDATLALEADFLMAPVVVTGFNSITVGAAAPELPSNLTHSLTIMSNGAVKVNDPGDDKLTLSLNPTAGTFTGSFFGDHEKRHTFQGVILQGLNNAEGFFLGSGQSSAVLIK